MVPMEMLLVYPLSGWFLGEEDGEVRLLASGEYGTFDSFPSISVISHSSVGNPIVQARPLHANTG